MRIILVGLMDFAILDARRCLDVYVSSVLPGVYSSFVQMNKHSVHTHTHTHTHFLSFSLCARVCVVSLHPDQQWMCTHQILSEPSAMSHQNLMQCRGICIYNTDTVLYIIIPLCSASSREKG